MLTAAVLSSAGLFVTLKRLPVTALYVKNVNGTGACTLLTSSCIPAFVISTGVNQAVINSSNGTRYSLFSTSTCGSSHNVYFL